MGRATGQRRGHCSVCGAGRTLQDNGTVPEHPVYRVGWNRNGSYTPRAYPSDRPEDARCEGSDEPPTPLAERRPSVRAEMRMRSERRAAEQQRLAPLRRGRGRLAA